MEFEHVGLVVDLDDEMFDELAANDAIEVLAQSRRQGAERQGHVDWLRKTREHRNGERSVFNVGADSAFRTRTAHANLTTQVQPQFFGAFKVDDGVLIASVKDE